MGHHNVEQWHRYGYMYVVHIWWGLNFKNTLLLANFLSVGLCFTFFVVLGPIPKPKQNSLANGDSESLISSSICCLNGNSGMNSRETARYVASLWPYMGPLCLVYFAEYCMQAGAWSAIGFPITSEIARKRFYVYANWMYQLGVFISRSSAVIFSPSPLAIQIAMPLLQLILMLFFCLNSISHFWYDNSLLVLCLCAGFLGGGVYVGSFILVAKKEPLNRKELALSAVTLADTVGICLADLCGLFIQACIYKYNHIDGSTVQCML